MKYINILSEEQAGSSAVLLTVEAPEPQSYTTPGQYCFLQNEKQKLPYAIASQPNVHYWQLLLRDSPLFKENKHKIKITSAQGSGFPLEKIQDNDIICITIGSGIGAMRSFLQHACQYREKFKNITLLYGERNEQRVPFLQEHALWREHDISVKKIYSEKGNYVYDSIEKKIKAETKILLVGSREMMIMTRLELAKRNIGPQNIFSNY